MDQQQPQTSGHTNAVKPVEANGAGPSPIGLNGEASPPAPPEAPPAPPLTPMGWLAQNGPYLILAFAVVVLIYVKAGGLDGVLKAAMVVFGLGFVIFIHELGHFATAKWCDVKVTTFSIGFGPALPGCSWQKGETTYKIALIPLGGYVQMVGEGGESDDQEEDPRSFKNKTVGQRMLIISAGVIMNIILGAVCFITVFRAHGMDRLPAVVWTEDPGSPAWLNGVRTGSVITKIDNIDHPHFLQLKIEVASSGKDESIPFTLKRDDKETVVNLTPYRDDNNMVPVIGVSPPRSLKLMDRRALSRHGLPVLYVSAAAAARIVPLRPGDVVLAATNPDDGNKVTDLPRDPAENVRELCRRMQKLGSAPMMLRVKSKGEGAVTEVEVPAKGFEFDDVVIGTTNPEKPNDTFTVKELEKAPAYLPGETHSPFDYRKRMRQLTGEPVMVQVQRAGSAEPINLLVPPAYHWMFGFRMKMGKVAAVREGSPAAGKILPGDVISEVTMIHDGTAVTKFDRIDPVRLAADLRRSTARMNEGKWQAKVKVLRPPTDPNDKRAQVDIDLVLDWDRSWSNNVEVTSSPASPTSVPELGIAFYIDSTIDEVTDKELARTLQPGDVFEEVAYREPGATPDAPEQWTNFARMNSIRGTEKPYDEWAYYFSAVQSDDFHQIKVKVLRGKERLKGPDGKDLELVLKSEPDMAWPLAERGMIFQGSYQLQKAHSTWEALVFGKAETVLMIKQIYINIANMISGRVSYKAVGGPIEIAAQAFSAAEDPWTLMLFLGMISVNLAVINFLPIPLLDGGHMTFLIYEKLRGKPPSDVVRMVATYVGAMLLLALIVFVFYLDIKRRFFGGQ